MSLIFPPSPPIISSIPALATGTLTSSIDTLVAVDGVSNQPKLIQGASIPSTVLVNDASIAAATTISTSDIVLVSQDGGNTLTRGTMSQLATFLGGGSVGQAIAVAAIADQAVSTSFTVSAIASGYTTTPQGGFQYRAGVYGTWTALPSPYNKWNATNSTLSITFTCPGITLASGLTAIYIRDATTTSIVGVSAPFAVGTTLPTGLGTLLAWFDASAGIPQAFSDTGLTTPSIAASSSGAGSIIGSLRDLSGQGIILTQATSGKQPFLQSAAINGLPGFTFGSAAQYLTLTTAAGTSTTLANLLRLGNITALVIYTPAATLVNSTIFAGSKAATGSGDDQCKPGEIRTSGKVYTARNVTSGLNNLISTGTYTGGTLIKEVSRIGAVGGGSLFQSVNASTEITATITGTDTSGGFDTIMMGGVMQGNVPTNLANAIVAEIVIFAGLNTSAASTTLATYATAKWGS